MLIENTTLQVPFLADLVLPVDPTSRFTFINYLKEMQRLFRFCIKEDNFITRKEYVNYCKWVAEQLDNCVFGHRVKSIIYLDYKRCYEILVVNNYTGNEHHFYTKRIVMGIGTKPNIQQFAKHHLSEKIFHNSNYLHRKQDAISSKSITIIGSGQSAGEVFYDLLTEDKNHSYDLNWFTRSPRFFPMEYAKLTHEFTSPDYIRYFYSLAGDQKEKVLKGQDVLYKGMNIQLINSIYDVLYNNELNENKRNIRLNTNCELRDIVKINNNEIQLRLYHQEQEKEFFWHTDSLILSTGYCFQPPSFLDKIKNRIQWDHKNRFAVNKNYSIDRNGNEIFVLNAELHTHGFLAPDLGMAPYRNATILNEIMGCEYYKMEKHTTFQNFSVPELNNVQQPLPDKQLPAYTI
ncbi:MAG TPA: SidA/IucD/PvdA family monooxygenase, partial [Chitinophagales bacterium]|nr:SidA/IucD/PvdA family monooxygenase [Chitinophagales bacterium]